MNVNQLAEQQQLGNLIERFQWETGESRNLLMLGIGLAIVCLPILVVVLPALWVNPTYKVAFWVLLFCVSMTEMSSLWLILDGWQRLRRKCAIALFEQGLIDNRRRRPIVIRYEDVNYFWTDIIARYQHQRFLGLSYVYTIEMHDRTKATFNDELLNVEYLGKIVRDRILDQQISQAITAYLQGEEIKFGTLTVTQSGISHDTQFATWVDLDEIQIQQGFITLSKNQGATHVAFFKVADFPNLDLFLTLVNWVKSDRDQETAA